METRQHRKSLLTSQMASPRRGRVLISAIVCSALLATAALAQQVNTSDGTTRTTTDSAFQLYWDNAADVWKFRCASSDTAGSAITWTDGPTLNTSCTMSGVSGGSLSGLSAAAANNTISNSAWNQVWNWQLTGAETGFLFGESAASTGGSSDQYILEAATLSGSTAIPFYIENLGNGLSFLVHDVASDTSPVVIDASGRIGIGTTGPTEGLTLYNTGIKFHEDGYQTSGQYGALIAYDNAGDRLRISGWNASSEISGISVARATGWVGIKDSSPAAMLEVAGEVKVGTSTGLTCSSTTEGSLRYDNVAKVMEFCNGTNWSPVLLALSQPYLVMTPTTATMNITGPGTPAYSAYTTFTVENLGNVDSGTISFTLTNTTHFEFGTNTCTGGGAVLSQSETCTIQVRAKAAIDTTYSGQLRVNANNQPTANLSGTSTGTCGTAGDNYGGGKLVKCEATYALVATPGGCTDSATPTCAGGSIRQPRPIPVTVRTSEAQRAVQTDLRIPPCLFPTMLIRQHTMLLNIVTI